MSQNNNPGTGTQHAPAYPQSVEINGTVYNVNDTPALKQFFESTVNIASTTEKNKLYPDLANNKQKVSELTEKLNKDAEQLQGMMSINAKLIEDSERYRAEIAELRKGNAVSTQEMYERMEQLFKANMPSLLGQYLAPVQEFMSSMKGQQLEAYKKQRIEQYNGEVIPEMITGTTVQEIDNQLANSHEIFKKYAARPVTPAPVAPAPVAPVQQQPVQQPLPAGQPLPVNTAGQPVNQNGQPIVQQPVHIPVVPRLQSPETTDIPDIKNMSREEFEKNRDRLFAQVSAYAQSHQEQLLAADPKLAQQ